MRRGGVVEFDSRFDVDDAMMAGCALQWETRKLWDADRPFCVPAASVEIRLSLFKSGSAISQQDERVPECRAL